MDVRYLLVGQSILICTIRPLVSSRRMIAMSERLFKPYTALTAAGVQKGDTPSTATSCRQRLGFAHPNLPSPPDFSPHSPAKHHSSPTASSLHVHTPCTPPPSFSVSPLRKNVLTFSAHTGPRLYVYISGTFPFPNPSIASANSFPSPSSLISSNV